MVQVGEFRGPDFLAGHLPGATYLPTSALEAPPSWNRRPRAEILGALGLVDLELPTPLALASRNPMAAFRAGAILWDLGLRNLVFLDGGIHAIEPELVELRQGEPQLEVPSLEVPALAGASPPEAPGSEDVFVDLAWIEAWRASPGTTQLVDIRSLAEHRGETSGYPYFSEAGWIPGSIWGGGGSSRDHLEDLRTIEDRMRRPGELKSFWESCGLDLGRPWVLYCGTGWRASEAYWFARELGHPAVRIYDGGWYEYSGASSKEPTETAPVRSLGEAPQGKEPLA